MRDDEFGIIEHYFTRWPRDPHVLLGIGDDAAVIAPCGPMAVAVDMLVAGTHFPSTMPARAVGYRVLAVNLSDMAAMGARPRWCTLALSLPTAEPDWLENFTAGLFSLAERHGVALIGGDLTRGPLTASLQIMGELASRDAMLRRAGAQPGDDVYVSGTLGDAAAGLALMQRGASQCTAAEQSLLARFLEPTPRVELGRALVGLATAAIDVSDGLLADLGHICRASSVGAEIEVERLPLSPALREMLPPGEAERHALTGGDDYELCFTAPTARAPALTRLGLDVTRIGRITEGDAVTCLRGGQRFVPESSGFRHF